MVTSSYKKAAYEKLKFYQNICVFRRLIYRIIERFPKSHIRLASQTINSARSANKNIREGCRKDTAGEFAHSIKISRGFLGELQGDIADCFEDSLIAKDEFDKLKDLFGQTNYQIDYYLDSLHRLVRDGKSYVSKLACE